MQNHRINSWHARLFGRLAGSRAVYTAHLPVKTTFRFGIRTCSLFVIYSYGLMKCANAEITDRARRIIVIVGPTASGKTAAAVELGERIDAEIVSADSMAIYKGMDIGTAKPTPEERRRVTFHLIDVVEPEQSFTVADYQDLAVQAVEEIISRGKTALVVGGTGLYVRALIDGLNIPGHGPDPNLRNELKIEAEKRGVSYLHNKLAEVDPRAASRIFPRDIKRIIRALEVYYQTGRPMTEVLDETRSVSPRYPDALWFGLTMERTLLYRRIEERVDDMIRKGLVDEVKSLLGRGYSTSMQSMQGLGYKEIAAYLEGKYDFDTAVETLKRNTRRFAKRQMTWFRTNDRIQWIDVENMSKDKIAETIMAGFAFDASRKTREGTK